MKSRIAVAYLSLALWLGGCANLTKVDVGEAVVKDNFVVKVDSAWNQFSSLMGSKAINWTKDGLYVDRLQFYVGVADGEEIEGKLNGAKEQRPLTFKASMPPHEIAQVFQNVLTRDGSTFTLGKLDPTTFLGGSGFRMEYSLIRKGDDVQMKGFAYGAVRNNKLYLLHFTAPRLAFFGRNAAAVEQMAQSARLKS
jgi:hypothetical protein